MKGIWFWVVLILALGSGLLIAWVDSRPSWDDTGISAAAVFLACAMLGMVMPKRAWLWALLVGAWIPLIGIIAHHNFGSLLALVIAFAGAYLGYAARKLSTAFLGDEVRKP
jgi:hypothetical protein